MTRGDRVIVNTGGADAFGVVTRDAADWKRLYPWAFKSCGPSVCVQFDEPPRSELWIPAKYVRPEEVKP